jgi:CheY-like chemotaxis protein
MKDFGQERPFVLVVDGEQDVLDRANEALTKAEIGCRCCTTADEALIAALTSPPDMIVCDWNLGGENGVETCDRIREQPGLSDVPVMFLSSAQRPDVVRRRLMAGHGVYCIRKPFTSTVLVELIDQALGMPSDS